MSQPASLQLYATTGVHRETVYSHLSLHSQWQQQKQSTHLHKTSKFKPAKIQIDEWKMHMYNISSYAYKTL